MSQFFGLRGFLSLSLYARKNAQNIEKSKITINPSHSPGLEMQAPGPSASVFKTLHLILSLSSPGKTLAQLFINSEQKS